MVVQITNIISLKSIENFKKFYSNSIVQKKVKIKQ